ncbi:MAG: hypothetical protein ACXU8A_08230 [Burkholderiaceae bacterium]
MKKLIGILAIILASSSAFAQSDVQKKHSSPRTDKQLDHGKKKHKKHHHHRHHHHRKADSTNTK